MRIGGFQKLSLIEYPGKLSAVVWTIGCNLRCVYCYNADLVLPERTTKLKEIPVDYVLSYLDRRRRSFLDALTVTGGEPTIHEDLPKFLRKIKQMNYLVQLETNGTNPSMLKRLIEDKLIDYVAMDVKTRLDYKEYNQIVGGVLTSRLFKNIIKSVKILLDAGIDYEFRTTLVKEFHRKEDVLELCKEIQIAKAYYLQNVKNFKGLIGGRKFTPLSEYEVKEILLEAAKLGVNARFRQ